MFVGLTIGVAFSSLSARPTYSMSPVRRISSISITPKPKNDSVIRFNKSTANLNVRREINSNSPFRGKVQNRYERKNSTNRNESSECQKLTYPLTIGVLAAASSLLADQYLSTLDVQNDQRPSSIARSRGFTYLKHTTDCSNVRDIIESGNLVSGQSINKTNYPRFTTSRVFLDLVHEDDRTAVAKNYVHCVLYFSLDLLDHRQDYHITNGWVYGEYFSGSVDPERYIHSTSVSARPDEIKKIKHVLDVIVSKTQDAHSDSDSEIVFKDPIDFKYLVKVYVGRGLENSETVLNRLQEAGVEVIKSPFSKL